MNNLLETDSQKIQHLAEDFAHVFYDAFDSRRYEMGSLYTTTATLNCNGTVFTGRENIENAYHQLPPSVHQITTITIQSLQSGFDKEDFVILIKGRVNFYAQPRANFVQNLLISKPIGQWRIVRDFYRLNDPME